MDFNNAVLAIVFVFAMVVAAATGAKQQLEYFTNLTGDPCSMLIRLGWGFSYPAGEQELRHRSQRVLILITRSGSVLCESRII